MKPRPALALLVLGLAGCGIVVDHRPQRRFVGDLVAASDPDACPPARGVLTIRQNLVSFSPDEGTWVLSGIAGSDQLTASRSQPGTDRKLYKTELNAQWTETAVHGTYTTPRCTYRVDLKSF